MAELIRISPETDFEEVATFQRRAFGHDWLKSERRRLQRAEYYQWKYFPPAGPAWLAAARSQRTMIAMVAAVPFAVGEGGSTAWQICDIATDPQFRSRGLFARCLAALGEAVGNDRMFCFPNRQSRSGLARAGYAVRTVLRIQAQPLGPAGRRLEAARAMSASLAVCETAFRVDPGRHFHVRRSPDFLDWRYGRHPLNRYVALHTEEGGAESCVIVRHLLNGRAALVVETWSGSEDAMGAAREAARRWAKGSGCWVLLATDVARANTGPNKSAARARLLPWDVVCYTREDAAGTTEGLHVQLGDWDAV